MTERFWISLDAGQTWRHVTRDEYVNLQRAITDPDSDGYFEEELDFVSSSNWVEGRVGDINHWKFHQAA